MSQSTTLLPMSVAIAIAAIAFAPASASAAPKPKLSSTQAEAAAVRHLPGKAISSKYEYEDGRWQYAVIVKGKQGLYEIEVDPTTGKVLDQERTSAAEEQQEAAAAKKHAH